MSRIGKMPLFVPNNVIIEKIDNILTIIGPLGKLFQIIPNNINIKINNKKIEVKIYSNNKKNIALHGLYRSLINNMIIGVTQGFTKKLELVGVGYRVIKHSDNTLEFNLGYSHNIIIQYPMEKINVITEIEKGKNPILILKSCNKQMIGILASKIRSLRPPEPYKGKGIRYLHEIIIRKTGKSA